MPIKVSSRSSRSSRPTSKPPSKPSASTANSRTSANTMATNNSSPPRYYKRPPLPMPLNNKDWPEAFGFTIAGDSPCYIISVEPGSHAHNAGLQPGDQLVELHNQNVTQFPANAVKSLAQQCSSTPPSIVVVSCVKTCDLVRDKNGRYGMTLIGSGPVYVEIVEPQSPADRAGMKSGDMVLEINGLQIRHSDDAKIFVHGSSRLKMVIIPGAGHQSVRKIAEKFQQQAKERAVRAEGFFRKLDAVFYNNPEKKDTLITLLKQYAKDKRVDNFGRALASLLDTTPQRQLFDDIRIFVPPKHRQRFDYLVSKDVPQSGKRIVRVDRSGGSFGFMLVGDTPVMVESVDPGGAAERSGLRAGDRILKLNGLDVRKKSHDRLIQLLQGSGSAPTIVVETGPPVPSGGYSTAASTIRSATTSQSRTTSSDASSVTGWMSESAVSKSTGDELDIARDLSKMDLYTVGRTFKEMMEHHLTSQERKLVKRALQGYQGNRNLDALIVEIYPILDTNAKRTLWPYIIQILPEEEQEVCKRKVIYLIDRHAADAVYGGQKKWWLKSAETGSLHPDENISERITKSPFSRTSASYEIAPSYGDVIFSSRKDEFDTVAEAAMLLEQDKRERARVRSSPRSSRSSLDYMRKYEEPDYEDDEALYYKVYKDDSRPQLIRNRRTDIAYNTSFPPSTVGSVKGSIRLYASSHGFSVLHENPVSQISSRNTTPTNSIRLYTSPRNNSRLSGSVTPTNESFIGPIVPPPAHLESTFDPIPGLEPYHDDPYASLRSHHSASSLASSMRTTPSRRYHISPADTIPYASERHPPRHSTGSMPPPPTDMPTSFVDDVIERPLTDPVPQHPSHHRRMTPPEYAQVYPRGRRPRRSMGSEESTSPLSKEEEANQTLADFRPRALHGLYLPGFSGQADSAELTELDDFMPGENSYYYHDSLPRRRPKRHSYPTIPEGYHNTSRRRSHQAVYAVDPLATVVTDLLASDHDSTQDSESYSSSRHSHSHHHGSLNANNNSIGHRGGYNRRHRSPPSVMSFDARSEISHHSASSLHSLASSHHSIASSHHSMASSHHTMTPTNGNSFGSFNGSLDSDHTFINGNGSFVEEVAESSFAAPPPAPPPPPPPPPPPMAPPPPPLPDNTDGGAWMQQKMSVKRLNWEKLQDTSNTVWSGIQNEEDDYLDDFIKCLELDEKFSTVNRPQGTQNKGGSAGKERKATVNIIAHKKAHNTAILLGHLRMPIEDIRASILAMDSSKFTEVQLQQMYSFSPSDEEVKELDEYQGKTSLLSQPDKFAYEMSRIPAYKLRVEALLFIVSFDEQIESIAEELGTIKHASDELRASQKLAKVLELVLAMGNYMNKGNQRVAGAVGFKITFLTELDTTKTSDNKSTFLHVVAKAVDTNIPDALSFRDEIPSVEKANKMSLLMLRESLTELEQKLQILSDSIDSMDPGNTNQFAEDRFSQVMVDFKSDATDRLSNMKTLFQDTKEEFNKTAQYFGEDPQSTESDKFFGIFSLFTTKFARAHHENLQATPRTPQTP